MTDLKTRRPARRRRNPRRKRTIGR